MPDGTLRVSTVWPSPPGYAAHRAHEYLSCSVVRCSCTAAVVQFDLLNPPGSRFQKVKRVAPSEYSKKASLQKGKPVRISPRRFPRHAGLLYARRSIRS